MNLVCKCYYERISPVLVLVDLQTVLKQEMPSWQVFAATAWLRLSHLVWWRVR